MIKMLAALVAALAVLVPTHASAAPVKTEVIFNSPKVVDPKGYDVGSKRFVKLVDGMPRGSTLRLAMFLLDDQPSVDAMIRAHKRGVRVRVALQPQEYVSVNRQVARLRAELGTSRRSKDGSYIVHPTGSGLSHAKTADMHAKVITISQSGASTAVTIVGSDNLFLGNVELTYNERQIIHNDPKMYTGMAHYFEKIAANKPLKKRLKPVTGTDRSRTVYLYPKAPNVTLAKLKAVRSCSGGRVWASVYFWSDARLDMAKQLRALWLRGCDVRINVTRDRLYPKVARLLLTPGTGRRAGKLMPVRDLRSGRNTDHRKWVGIDTPDVKANLSGSRNWTGKGSNADTVMLDRNRARLAQYMKAFEPIHKRGKTLVMPVSPASSIPPEGGDQ